MNQAVAAYGRGLGDLTALQEEIVRCTGEDRVYDEASPYPVSYTHLDVYKRQPYSVWSPSPYLN